MKKGFSLLELLVVILIIGILAAVALPQYYKAKEKAEAVELQILVKALHESQQRYFMVHNAFAKTFGDLDMDYDGYKKGGCEDFSMFQKEDCLSNEKNVLFISTGGSACFSLRKTGRYKYSGFVIRMKKYQEISADKLYCYEMNDKKLCSKVFNCDYVSSISGNNNYYSCPY